MNALSRFFSTYLSPADRLAELVCGLVMVLTFTLTASVAIGEGPEGKRELLVATIGCNLAWGIIDGVAYVMARLVARGRRSVLASHIRNAPDERAALDAIARELDDTLAPVAEERERLALYRGIRRVALRGGLPAPRLQRDDLLGALAILAIDLMCTVPAAVPFLLIRNGRLALRVSNALLVSALFAVGYRWARHVGGRRWVAGLALASVGLALVGVAIALGG